MTGILLSSTWLKFTCNLIGLNKSSGQDRSVCSGEKKVFAVNKCYMKFLFYIIDYKHLLQISNFTMSSSMDYIRGILPTHCPLQNSFSSHCMIHTNCSNTEKTERCSAECSPVLLGLYQEGTDLTAYYQAHRMERTLFLGCSHHSLLYYRTAFKFWFFHFSCIMNIVPPKYMTMSHNSLPTSPSQDAYSVFICHFSDRRHTSILAK